MTIGERSIKIAIFLFMIVMFLEGIALGMIYERGGEYYLEKFKPEPTSFEKNYSDICAQDNLSLHDTSKCLRDYVRTFYNYTIRSDIIRTDENIKQYGGDCHDYTLMYIRMFKRLGYNTKKINFYGNDSGHTFVLVWDENIDEYCKVDLLNAHCMTTINVTNKYIY